MGSGDEDVDRGAEKGWIKANAYTSERCRDRRRSDGVGIEFEGWRELE